MVNGFKGLFYGYMQREIQMEFEKSQGDGHGKSNRKKEMKSIEKEKDITQRNLLHPLIAKVIDRYDDLYLQFSPIQAFHFCRFDLRCNKLVVRHHFCRVNHNYHH